MSHQATPYNGHSMQTRIGTPPKDEGIGSRLSVAVQISPGQKPLQSTDRKYVCRGLSHHDFCSTNLSGVGPQPSSGVGANPGNTNSTRMRRQRLTATNRGGRLLGPDIALTIQKVGMTGRCPSWFSGCPVMKAVTATTRLYRVGSSSAVPLEALVTDLRHRSTSWWESDDWRCRRLTDGLERR